MANIANFLENSSKEEILDLFGSLYNEVLRGENETADRDLFLALEKNDLQKAKEIYNTVFQPFFKSMLGHKEAA